MVEENKLKTLEVIVLAGKLLLENGSEISRVEDTMIRIGKNSNYDNIVVFVTPTGIFASFRGEAYSQMESIPKHSINLEKINFVNELSRTFDRKEITIQEFHKRLLSIDQSVNDFSLLMKMLGSALVSSSLMFLFSGNVHNLVITFIIGGSAYGLFAYLNKLTHTEFLSYGITAFFIGLTAMLAVKFHLGMNANEIIIGCVMPFVPGVKLVNAFSDGIKGHSISSVTFLLQALLVACSIGIGVVSSLLLFRG